MINTAFKKFKSNIELSASFDEKIIQKHNSVRSVIENINSSYKTKLIGSVGRKTAINPKSEDEFDIDILVVMGSFDRWVYSGGIRPQDVMNDLGQTVCSSQRYGSMAPKADDPVIVFEYGDGVKVELVPAYRDEIGKTADGSQVFPKGRGYWIPKNGRWEMADYDHEADHITLINQSTEGLLVPIIKMLKTAKRKHFPKMGSFHLEILATKSIPLIYNTLKQRSLPTDFSSIISIFFSISKDDLQNPQKIPNSSSSALTHDLSDLINHQIMFGKINDHCLAINNESAVDKKISLWKDLFGDPFPLAENLKSA